MIIPVIGMQAQTHSTKKHTHKKHDTIRFTTPPVALDSDVVPPPMEITDRSILNRTAGSKDDAPVGNGDTSAIKFMVPDEEAQFPGGQEAMYRYIRMNLKYPEMAKEAGIEGKVYLSFIIDTSGSVIHIKIIKSANEMFNKESIRCIENMPKWTPAKMNHKKIRTGYNLPLSFHLQ